MTDGKGFYSFPSLPVGRYDLKLDCWASTSRTRKGLIDRRRQRAADRFDHDHGREGQQELTVSDSAGEVQLETVSTQMGDVVTGKKMTAVALNGRSFTDLLALQPGIVPMSTQTPDSIVMAGASVAIAPRAD